MRLVTRGVCLRLAALGHDKAFAMLPGPETVAAPSFQGFILSQLQDSNSDLMSLSPASDRMVVPHFSVSLAYPCTPACGV